MSPLIKFMFCASVAACGGLPSATVETTSASVSTFGGYRTYSFAVANEAPGEFRVSERTIDVQHRMMPLIADALAQKGYVNVPEGGDLLVVVAAGEGQAEKERHRTRTATAVMGEHEEIIKVPAGSLLVDVFDTAKQQRVWEATALAEVHRNGIDEKRLAQTIDQMMTKFPARR